MSIKFGYACYISHEYIVQEVIAIEYLAAYAGYISLLTIIPNNSKTKIELQSKIDTIENFLLTLKTGLGKNAINN